MKTPTTQIYSLRRRAALGTALITALGLAGPLFGQSFDAGSDGSLGDVSISSNTTLNLPADGKLHFRSLIVNSGVTLRFNRNAQNTPVFVLAQTEVVVNNIAPSHFHLNEMLDRQGEIEMPVGRRLILSSLRLPALTAFEEHSPCRGLDA